jgi:hypothetical protein
MEAYTDQQIWDEAVKRGIVRAVACQRRVSDFELSARPDDYRGFIQEELTRRLARELSDHPVFVFREQSSPWADNEQMFTALVHVASIGRRPPLNPITTPPIAERKTSMRFRKPPPVGAVIDWHPYFAWHPVDVGDYVVWLEWVERQREVRLVSNGEPWGWPQWVSTYRLPVTSN